MFDQDENGDFSEHGLARNTDPITSHEAAVSVKTNRLEQLVVDYLLAYGNSITEQICVGLHLPWKTVSPRLRPLCKKGKVYEAGYAIASTGRRVIVWGAVEDWLSLDHPIHPGK